MKSVFKSVVVAGVLASAGFPTFSQAPARGDYAGMMSAANPMHEGMGQHRMGPMDPAKVQVWRDKRNAAFKARLKLTTDQEGPWTTYIAAMKPPADLVAQRSDFAELTKLSTPERIDKMKALRTQHLSDMNAVMDKRGEATKTFYATLTPEQQKVFDANAMRHQDRFEGRRSLHHGKVPA